MALRKFLSLATAMSLLPYCVTTAVSAESAWPSSNLAEFVFTHLDLTSFRNSTGPRRETGKRYFGDLGIKPNKVSATSAVSDVDGWTYSVRILGQRDYNKDGVQEIAICFSDDAQEGTYSTQHPYLVQLLEGRAVALGYDITTDSD